MPQLLVELLSEEIPARMQLGAARDLERLFDAKLKASGLGFDSLKAYVGPRRLALVVEGLPVEQAAVSEEVKGPREGAPPAALEGFLRKTGLTQDQLTLENGVWYARIEKPGSRTVDALPGILREVILNFPWPKSMRSGTSSFRWVRPLKNILFLFDGAVVPFELEGLVSTGTTYGHRFLGSKGALSVTDFKSYISALRKNSVILDHADRQDVILDEARKVCSASNCELIEDQGLLEEVAGLNEFPIPLLGDMDPRFLALPPEVIKTSMRTHQKYFAVRDAKTGKMAPHFVLIANVKAADGGEEIRRGNAKVLSARLSDGVFFWSEDNKPGNFDRWLEKLKGVTFQTKLGTMAQRVARISALAVELAPLVGANPRLAEDAARLCKADLASYMVGEFPELQGIMGGYYADEAGLAPEVINAIRDHYKPQGPSDSVPEHTVSAVVALADKLDTLIAFFAIDEKPTGSKDPYALRRSALGILRILRQHNVRVQLSELVARWYRGLMTYAGNGMAVHVDTENWRGSAGPRWSKGEGDTHRNYVSQFRAGLLESPVWVKTTDRDYDFDFLYEHVQNAPAIEGAVFTFRPYSVVCAELEDFFAERLKGQLREEGMRHDIIEAGFAVKDGDVNRLMRRLKALDKVLEGPEGAHLVSTWKRAANILSAEEKKAPLPQGEAIHMPGAEQVEAELYRSLVGAQAQVKTSLKNENFVEALQHIAALRKNLDAFLDEVLVNAEDEAVKANRLRLLSGVCALSEDVADLSRIV